MPSMVVVAGTKEAATPTLPHAQYVAPGQNPGSEGSPGV